MTRSHTTSAPPTGPDAATLTVRGLTVTYGGLRALDQVDLSLPAGHIVGLIGPNGAGKTTCIDAVTGFTSQTAGSITIADQRIDHLRAFRRTDHGLVRTFQSLELYEDLTVREHLMVSERRRRWWSGVRDALWPWPQSDPRVDAILDRLDLLGVAEQVPEVLSNGQRHRVALGRALAGRPRFLLLDEPAAGLDPGETEELAGILRSVAATGVGVLLVDHDMALVLGTCDHVVVLDFGRVIAAGSPAEIRGNPTVVRAYLGGPDPEAS